VNGSGVKGKCRPSAESKNLVSSSRPKACKGAPVITAGNPQGKGRGNRRKVFEGRGVSSRKGGGQRKLVSRRAHVKKKKLKDATRRKKKKERRAEWETEKEGGP